MKDRQRKYNTFGLKGRKQRSDSTALKSTGAGGLDFLCVKSDMKLCASWTLEKETAPHYHITPTSQKKREFCCSSVFLSRKSSRVMEIAKEQTLVAENGPSPPDIGKRHFNKTVARKFGMLPPQAYGVQVLAISQIQALFLWHSNPHFTLNVM